MPRLREAEHETRLPSAEPEFAQERREFRRTAIFVVGVHLLVLVGFGIFAKHKPKPQIEQIAWLDGGLLGGGEAPAAPPEPEPLPPPPDPAPEPPKPPPAPTNDLAIATPPPATPKPDTPKPSPKPTPKTTPRTTPKPATKKPATAKPSASKKPKTTPSASPKATAKANASSAGDSTSAAKANTSKGEAAGEGKGKGTEGSGTGAGKPGDFSSYFAGLRDRYYAVWAPPSVENAATLVVTLKIRVKRDGTVLAHELVKSSGNSLMDGSVIEAARQVPKIDPLPPGLGREDIVEIPINFKPE